MIVYTAKNKFDLSEKNNLSKWIEFVIHQEEKNLGEINYIFCNDNDLLEINIKHLNHNTLTDIISFDFSLGDIISGDVFISTERIAENALGLGFSFQEELHRVMIHGILHYCGYGDKTEEQKTQMRAKEDYYLSLRTF